MYVDCRLAVRSSLRDGWVLGWVLGGFVRSKQLVRPVVHGWIDEFHGWLDAWLHFQARMNMLWIN